MRTFAQFALTIALAAAVFVSCSGSQPPIGAPGAAPQSYARAQRQHQSSSAEMYLYVREWANRQIAVLTFPQGQKVRTFTDVGFLCTDPTTGDLYVIGGELDEYAPGGVKKLGTATFPSGYAEQGCAVDPQTGSIAVASTQQDGSPTYAALLIYPDINAAPTIYIDSGASYFAFCGYDNNGNLFADGSNFAELPSGGDNVVNIGLDHPPLGGTVQWDGTYITAEDASNHPTIYRISVKGSTGTVVGRTKLGNRRFKAAIFSWIQGNVALAPWGDSRKNKFVGYWNYPEGGRKPSKVKRGFDYAYELVTGIVGSH